MKYSASHSHRAVRYLACAFGITLAALIALAAGRLYREHAETERYAELMAGDILALRDSLRAEDGQAAIRLALLDARSAELLTEAEQHALRSALLGEDPEPLAREIEEAFLQNRFSASMLKTALRRFYAAHAAEKTESDTESDVLPLSYRPISAARLAGEFFGFAPLFRESSCAAGEMAYCRNAYAVFDGRRGKMTEFAVFSPVEESVLGADECVLRAVSFLQDKQNMHPTAPGVLGTEEGICCVRCPHRDGVALVGVREDSGGICLFIRTWKSSPQMKDPAETVD